MTLAPEHFETERLALRCLRQGDASLIFNAYGGSKEVTKYMNWPTARHPDDLENFVTSNIMAFAKGTAYEYVISLRGHDEIIGGAGIHRAKPDNDACWTFGYCLAPQFWGQGLAIEVVRAFVSWFHNSPGVFRLDAQVDVENPASSRVLEKAGLQCEGVLRKWDVHPNVSAEPRDIAMFSVVK